LKHTLGTTALFLSVLALACATPSADTAGPRVVPLVALLAAPDHFDAEPIAVTSWAAVEFELAALFLSPADKKNLIHESGIWLDAPQETFASFPVPFEGFVRVEGVFRSGDPARGFRGRIEVKHLVEHTSAINSP
jgi:hypothetical protein